MDIAELSFACQIRNIAVELRSTARSRYYGVIYEDLDDQTRRAKLAHWDRENPIEKYVTIALLEIEEMAQHIRDLRMDFLEP